MPAFPFAAALLAGGRSTRMGIDKATIEIDGRPLWQRQLDKLRALKPAEFFISGRSDGPYHAAGVEVIPDLPPGGLGPLAGISALLERMESPCLLVLAVDLPAMTTDWLHGLLAGATPSRARVGKFEARYEPLAALYPHAALEAARDQLAAGDRSLHSWLDRLHAAGLLDVQALSDADLPLFHNWNTPGDVQRTGYPPRL